MAHMVFGPEIIMQPDGHVVCQYRAEQEDPFKDFHGAGTPFFSVLEAVTPAVAGTDAIV